MRQVIGLTSTYSSDAFGICSALYELGGMVIMHDASGCNSTYTTHDEPRWYDMDSMVFISAISEMEAILGDDEKFIRDIVETAEELDPKFIALVSAPIPYMIGTDMGAIAEDVSGRTGLPCFAFDANGMHDYTVGVSAALERIVGHFAREAYHRRGESHSDPRPCPREDITVNILGATPLDFSLNGSVESMREWIAENGMKNGVCLAMGCSLEEAAHAGEAQVNLVVSASGLAAAKVLGERFGIPYVVGVPVGELFSACLAGVARGAAATGESCEAWRAISRIFENPAAGMKTDAGDVSGRCGGADKAGTDDSPEPASLAFIGESVFGLSLAAAIGMEHGRGVSVLCPLETGRHLLRPEDFYTPEEDDIMWRIRQFAGVIADPLYEPLVRGKKFYPSPHEAFSGRMYSASNPNLIGRRLKKESGKLPPAQS